MAERTITLDTRILDEICNALASKKEWHLHLGRLLASEMQPSAFLRLAQELRVAPETLGESWERARKHLVDGWIKLHKKEIPKVIDAPIRVLGRPNRRKKLPETP